MRDSLENHRRALGWHRLCAAAATVALLGLAALAAPPARAATNITLRKSFAGHLNFVGTEATLRTASNNTDACSVTNGASATLSGIPSTATIKAAYLYWAGSSSPDSYLYGYYYIGAPVPPDYTVTFQGQSVTAPADEQYLVRTTNYYGLQANFFSGVADVTSIVNADRNGTYTLSGLDVDTRYYTHCEQQTVLAGWSLLVIYSDPGEDFRVVNVYQGFRNFQANSITLSPSNFQLPSTASQLNGKFAHITWEGDVTNSTCSGGYCEQLQFNGNTLTDAVNPPNNQFNSKSTIVSPADTQSYGVDFDEYDVTPYLSPNETSATSTYSSGQDLVLLSAEIMSVANTAVSDLAITDTHSGNPAPGDTIQYTLTVQNNGPLEEPGPITVTDTLPSGVNYVSASGTNWTCSNSGGTVTCKTPGPLASGSQLPAITVTAAIPMNTSSPIVNTASVSGANFDNRTGNNTSQDTATWTNPPPLTGPDAFNANEVGTPQSQADAGPIYTKIAGRGYSLYLWAFDRRGRVDHNPRASGELYLLDASDNSGTETPAGSGCRSTWYRVKDLGPFDFHRPGHQNPITVTLAAYAGALPDAHIEIVQTGGRGRGGNQIACSSDAFAVRPAYFSIRPTDADWVTAGLTRTLNATSPSGAGCATSATAPCHKAGQPFTVTLVPEDAAGNPIPGYGSPGAPDVTGALTLAPSSGVGGILGTFSPGSFTVPPARPATVGKAISTTATYADVGAIGLRAIDSGFAAVDASDGTAPCQRTIGEDCSNSATPPYWAPNPTTVGRFVPDHFAVTKNAPEFTTFCPAPGSATGGFTYVGKPFNYAKKPVMTVTAENASGVRTRNYASFSSGNWFRLTAPDLMSHTPPSAQYSDENARGIDTAALPDPDVTVTPASGTHGVGYIDFTAGATGIDYTRNAATAPFPARIDIRQQVVDEDAVKARPSATVTFANVAWNGGDDMRYGRLALRNAYGSELMSLKVPLTTQYYVGADTGFVKNTLDHCTSTLAKPVTLGPYTGNLSGHTSATFTEPPAAGSFGLALTAPGAGNTGSVRISVKPASGETLSWLKYAWTSATAPQTFPTALAVFGIYQKGAGTVFTHRVSGGGD